MKINPKLFYNTFDPETDLFFQDFDESTGIKVLEIGSQHSPIASILQNHGMNVTGVDLRDSDQQTNYQHIKADFCKMPTEWLQQNLGTFDCVVCVSAIEHFGLNAYGEGVRHSYYDVLAMRYAYDLLKTGGKCYITTPFGGKFVEHKPHWRVYDWASLLERIVQDFTIESFYLQVCEKIEVNGKKYEPHEQISLNEAILNVDGFPNISCFLKMRK